MSTATISVPRGAIFSTEAYAHAKMLDHSNLYKVLRDGIRPSDIDAVIDPDSGEIFNPTYVDSAGKIIYLELTRGAPEWRFLKRGQRLGYENLVRGTDRIAILAHHDVTPEMGRPIDTLNDLTSFQAMVWENGPKYSAVFIGQPKWEQFISSWVRFRAHLWRDYILGRGDWKPKSFSDS
jgi:hypothetical protein